MAKIFYPVVGLAEKAVKLDIVQKILAIFRDTQDIHRVAIIVPLTLFLSHSLFMSNQPHIAVIFHRLTKPEIFWIVLAAFSALFMLAWSTLSSNFNPALYARQMIVAGWTFILHRIAYGLTALGSPDFYIPAFVALSVFLPFAVTGLRIDDFFKKLKEDYETKKQAEAAMVARRHPAVIQEPESDAA